MRKTKIALVGGASLLGLGATALGIRYVVMRDRPSKKELLLMGIPATALLTGVVDAELGMISAKEVLPERMKKPPPPRLPRPAPPGIKVWGTTSDEPNIYWNPGYLKSDGCKDFRWGLCFNDLMDSIQKDPDAPKWAKSVKTIVPRVADVLAAGAGKIAEWIADNVCLRFKFPIYGYYWSWGGSRWLAVRRYDADAGLIAATPMHPFPRRSGYKRVWFSKVEPPRTRSKLAFIVYWPDEKTPKMSELLQVVEIRKMLRLDHGASGSIRIKELADAACGKSTWWLARRKNAMAEFA